MPLSILDALEAATKPLTVKEAAKIFDVPEKKIYAMVQKGKLPCLRMEATIKFDPAALAYWVCKQDPELAKARRMVRRALADQPVARSA